MADGRQNNGGVRPGSGRKSWTAREEFASLLADTISEDDKRQVLRRLVAEAKTGDVRAIGMFLSYWVGNPLPMEPVPIDPEEAAKPRKIVVEYEKPKITEADSEE